MKKLILVLTLLSLINVTYSQKSFKLTFLASPQISWLKSESSYVHGDKSFLGFGYGVEGDYFLGSENYTLNTGMTVSTVGGTLIYDQSLTINGIVLPAGSKVDYSITNLEFPLAIKMRTKDFNRYRYFAQFGLTNWLNIKSKATTTDRLLQKETTRGVATFYNVGLNVGAGLEYDMGGGNAITGGLVYSNGFIKAIKNFGVNDDTSLKVLRFRLGFMF